MSEVLETIVCSAKSGKEARLERMLSLRVEFRLRQDGCIKSWYAKSIDDENIYIFQTLFVDRDRWLKILDLSKNTLDPKDGGVESCLMGPPLVGIFDINSNNIVN